MKLYIARCMKFYGTLYCLKKLIKKLESRCRTVSLLRLTLLCAGESSVTGSQSEAGRKWLYCRDSRFS